MIKFTTETAELKKALSIVALATGKISTHIQSHALFSIKGDEGTLYSTDEDKVATSHFSISDIELEGEGIQFTAEPKNLYKLLSSSGSSKTSFTYEPETKTLKVYTSENKKSFLSFASFDPKKFLSLNLSSQELQHTINIEVLLDGIKFIQGFLNEKDEKFSNLFVLNNAFYGANGNTKVGAFTSPDIEGSPNLILRKSILSPLVTMVEKSEASEVAIKISDKLITFYSPDDRYCFGFRKSLANTPKFPISTEEPKLPKFNIERTLFLKKLNRLSLTSWEDVGIKMTIKDNENLEMETVGERPSFETVPCKCNSEEPLYFIIQCDKFKAVLNQFKASNVEVFIAKNKCFIYSNAEIIIEEDDKEPVKKSFTAIGLMTLARIVK
jgi:hypothetical protein